MSSNPADEIVAGAPLDEYERLMAPRVHTGIVSQNAFLEQLRKLSKSDPHAAYGHILLSGVLQVDGRSTGWHFIASVRTVAAKCMLKMMQLPEADMLIGNAIKDFEYSFKEGFCRDYDEHAERVVIPSLRREMQVVKDVIDEYKLDMPENRRLHRALGIEIRTGASGNQWFYRVGPVVGLAEVKTSEKLAAKTQPTASESGTAAGSIASGVKPATSSVKGGSKVAEAKTLKRGEEREGEAPITKSVAGEGKELAEATVAAAAAKAKAEAAEAAAVKEAALKKANKAARKKANKAARKKAKRQSQKATRKQRAEEAAAAAAAREKEGAKLEVGEVKKEETEILSKLEVGGEKSEDEIVAATSALTLSSPKIDEGGDSRRLRPSASGASRPTGQSVPSEFKARTLASKED